MTPRVSWRTRAIVAGMVCPAIALFALGTLGAGKNSASPAVTRALLTLLRDARAGTRAGALEWLLHSPEARDPALDSDVIRLASDRDAGVRDTAVRNLDWVIANGGGATAQSAAIRAFSDSDATVKASAFELLKSEVSKNTQLSHSPDLMKAGETAIGSSDAGWRDQGAVLLLSLRTAAIGDRATIDADLRRAMPALSRAVQEQLASALGVILPPLPPPPVVDSAFAQNARFDFGYFAAYVLPQLTRPNKSANGESCVSCHYDGNQTVGSFFLVAPPTRGQFTMAMVEENYRRVVAAVNSSTPLNSTFLLKGLNNRVLDGRSGQDHGGGVFWLNDHEPGYLLITGWLQGDKLNAPLANVRDFQTFVASVEPILSETGPDNDACVNCHATHTVLNLQPPAIGGAFSVDAMRHNYESLLRLIDNQHPENSLFLLKPTWEKGGLNGQSHAGGVRWPEGHASPEYKTLLEWVSSSALQ